MQDDWEALNRQQEPIFRAKDSLEFKMNILRSNYNTPKIHTAYMILLSEYDRYTGLQNQIEYRFISLHPDSYLSPYLMNNYFYSRELSLDSAEMLYNTFTPLVKNSIAGESAQKLITERMASAVGSMAPLFTETDINGQKLILKSFRNKNYVLLDLWASWCKESQHLKHLYIKYHSKGLEIIDISFDTNKNDWRDAMIKDSMTTWHHALAGNGNLRAEYDIDSTPPAFLVLIDKNGKIIGRYADDTGYKFESKNGDNEGTMDDLDKMLAKVFNDN